jgi:hypothetical protein
MVHLFINSFAHPDPKRDAELADALGRNKSCKFIDRVHEITDPARPTFRQMCEIARKKAGWADVVIIANSDIFFDDSAALLQHIGYQECFALSRHEGISGDQLCINPQGSQDVWVFRGWPPEVAADFPLGTPGGDQRIARLLSDAGVAVYNPSLSIRVRHLHADARVRSRDESNGIGEGNFVPPCKIEHIRHRPGDAISKPGRIAIVQLGRFGDITNSLPIAFDLHRQGNEIFWYVCPKFAPLLEGVSYVTPVIWNGPETEPAAAIADARAKGYDRVLDIQVKGNPNPSPVKTTNYSSESWARAGYLEKYHILPSVFDRAKPPPDSWKPDGSMPILAYCLDSHSSPYSGDLRQNLVSWLEAEFASQFTLLPIGAPDWRPDTLAVVLSECRVLISIDSFPLHIGYAAGIPTIALTNEGWQGSEPRRNWIAHVTYSESPFAEGRQKIASALRDVLENRIRPNRLIHKAGDVPAQVYSQVRKLSILIPWDDSLKLPQHPLLQRLASQALGHQEVEILVGSNTAGLSRWQKQNALLARACGEYCCFMDAGDNVADGFVGLMIQSLLAGPDCVGFKVGRYRDGKVQQVERHAADFEEEDEDEIGQNAPAGEEIPRGVTPVCPIRTEIARKIGFDSGGDDEYSQKLAESGLIDSEQFINAVIYARPI